MLQVCFCQPSSKLISLMKFLWIYLLCGLCTMWRGLIKSACCKQSFFNQEKVHTFRMGYSGVETHTFMVPTAVPIFPSEIMRQLHHLPPGFCSKSAVHSKLCCFSAVPLADSRLFLVILSLPANLQCFKWLSPSPDRAPPVTMLVTLWCLPLCGGGGVGDRRTHCSARTRTTVSVYSWRLSFIRGSKFAHLTISLVEVSVWGPSATQLFCPTICLQPRWNLIGWIPTQGPANGTQAGFQGNHSTS